MTPRSRAARALAIAVLGWSTSACGVVNHEAEGTARAATLMSEAPTKSEASEPRRESSPAARTEVGLAGGARPTAGLPADALAPPADARREPCGSLSRRLSAGSGKQLPNDDDRVVLEYALFADSGRPLDSSATHGEPIANSVRHLGPGLPCVVKLMSVGESRRVWVGAALQPAAEEGPRSTPARDLVFDITLRQVLRAPPRPTHYASPSPAAQRTASGLYYQFLRRGSGERRPVANSRVTVSHSGWTNRGVLFASSALAGEPASFVTHELPLGLGEGIQLMRVGDKARFWLPERLAYETAQRSAPRGPVVFDVELLGID